MINIKLSSHKWEKKKKTPFAQSFSHPKYSKELRDTVLTFNTGDPNITVYADDDNFFLSFVIREYYKTTQEAIERLQQIQIVEERFKDFIESL